MSKFKIIYLKVFLFTAFKFNVDMTSGVSENYSNNFVAILTIQPMKQCLVNRIVEQ